MDTSVRPQIYATMPVQEVEAQLRRGKMPDPFTRRMRVINLLSAVTLRKIEDNYLEPFEVMDIHHVLDKQISQDAIISILDSETIAAAIDTGNLQPLWVESKEKPLLRKGFEQGWIQRFIQTPFDPICVMLAMRAKLLLDAVDELGHSYDLLRSLGLGWIDFGEIPGEEAGDPDSYIPPIIDTPIDYPDLPPVPVPGDPDYVPGPGEPDYIPPGDLAPGDPGYTPGPSDPGYIPPGELVPGDPGYVPGPGDQGFIPPPGYETIVPGHPDYIPGPGEPGYTYPPSPGGGRYGGDFGPGGEGAAGGPYGAEGAQGSLSSPSTLGFGPSALSSSRRYFWGWWGDGLNCCLDSEDPESFVTIGYFTSEIDAGEALGLTVEHAHEDCDGENYEWVEVNGVGSLSAESGLDVIYTAPATGHNCPGNAEIQLLCGGEVVGTLIITINYGYAIEFNYGDPELEIAREDSLIIGVTANNTPLTWAVAGEGFSLEHGETDGGGNILHAGETACGSATITVTGCDGQQAIGYVRCTTGGWVQKALACVMGGSGTINVLGLNFTVELIEGNKKQFTYYTNNVGTRQEAYDVDCATSKEIICIGEQNCLTFTLPCNEMWGGQAYACSGLECVRGCWKIPYTNDWELSYVRYTPEHIYYEWEC